VPGHAGAGASVLPACCGVLKDLFGDVAGETAGTMS
jgi:hypothetical protein